MARKREHVHGPYPHRQRWRLHYRDADGRTTRLTFASESEAAEAKVKILESLASLQMSDAVAEFLEHSRARGLSSGTVDTLGYRLRAVLKVGKERTGGPVSELTPARARRLFDGYAAAVDTKAGALAACRAFGSFCATHRYLRADPFVECKVVGKKKRGKLQLTTDEARSWFATAMQLAGEGDAAALAALLCLLLGNRSGEVRDREVRDVDDRGRVLVITRGKTENARRRVAIPEVLQPLVAQQVAPGGKRRRSSEPLFPREGGATRGWLLWHVKRICRAAKVTEVTTQSLRGLQATLATAAHQTAEAVAAQLGHSSPKVTARHYLAPGAAAAAKTGRALKVLDGGRS